MHADIGQRLQDGGHIGQFGPVELDVLARGEVAGALVPYLRDMGQLAHLVRVDRAVRNGHAQHIGMQLQIKAVHQAQRAEFFFGQRPVKAAFHLMRELRDTFADEGFVEFGIAVHSGCPQFA